MEKGNPSKSNENYKNLVDCYYLLLKKFKTKSSYVIDEFLIKENKESNGTLTIYEDVNIVSFSYLILSMIDSNYDVINKINILNVQNANDIIKALCFYMDNVQISDILKKNTKPIRKKDTNIQKNNKTSLKKKETKPNNNAQEEKNNDIIKKNTCNIKSLNLFNSNIDINGIIFLSKSLYDNKYSKLENLSIDCISMDMDCIKYLSLSLCNYNNLKTLSLQYCNLNDDSIKYIIDIVIYLNSSLYSLNICGNKFTEKGMCALFESFSLNSSLNIVDASYNMFILKDSFVDALHKIIQSETNISNISLTGNFIDDNNLSKINEAMNFNKSISILKLPNEVDTEILKQINSKLIKKKRKKKKQIKKKLF
ncbi:hypothetical protein CYL21_3900 [Plasmodium falciparum NF54]|uniref:Leucine-rich repeat protein n=10 Tax=Plasmodium falciparum TaxID=5833 RepID=A0A144A0B2_PLAF7|nr:conserved Plasmodium protein, unknown function [Plasmodium falciparum 3D7]KAF4328161.1 hypothetical protein CYL21_3900 [Plasmodium falciparum NF54]PKC43672.1 hypothetical protein CK202_4902 [Plasmodium falciparum NF54]CZT98640.1 conserved Plasmodium protein, unknown function [Plasmodium falciparum 3D7]|eukprot:XP_024329113.1 conserved Plasmodium protein, unknown function [Plasmodium falciparum 3D7]